MQFPAEWSGFAPSSRGA